MTPFDKLIYIVVRERVSTKGYIDLHTTFGEGNLMKNILIWYLVIDGICLITSY